MRYPVDSPHYAGAFQFNEAAEIAGFQEPLAYNFDPNKYNGYQHSMTHQDESAIDGYNKFCTLVFIL